MKTEKIFLPTVLVSPEKALFFGRRFRKIAAGIKNFSLNVEHSLLEAGINIPAIDYISAGIFVTLLMMAMLFGVSMMLALVAMKQVGALTTQFLGILLVLIFVVPFVYFLYFINYPKLVAEKRKALIDEKVVFAIREVMIKVGSGVPVFNAILDVANGDYGIVSAEFKETVEEIESGISQEQALLRLSARVPSQSLRRAVDILVNAIKSGSDVHGTLELINDMLIKKQQSDMRAYSAELTPLSMAYMLVSVVLPSLGMSVFLILGSLAKTFNTLYIVYLIPPFLLIFEIFFMGMVGNRRPAVGV